MAYGSRVLARSYDRGVQALLQFQTRHSVKKCLLEVFGEEGKLANWWCVIV